MNHETVIGIAGLLLAVLLFALGARDLRRLLNNLKDAIRKLETVQENTSELRTRLAEQVDKFIEQNKASSEWQRDFIQTLYAGQISAKTPPLGDTAEIGAAQSAAAKTIREAILRWSDAQPGPEFRVEDLAGDLDRFYASGDVRVELRRLARDGIMRIIEGSEPLEGDKTFVLMKHPQEHGHKS